MAMGTHKDREAQEELWVPHTALPQGASHPFYQRLYQLLEESHFDEFVEGRCQRFYAKKRGRPSLVPGVYFRLLLIGYFEGIDSERGMAWRANDSLALRRFLRVGLEESPPDHSTISRTRRLIDVETHREVFTWVLGVLAKKGLLKGKTLGIDATTLEANAALRTIVRRDTGEGYQEFLKRLAQESGIATPTREQLARLDRKRAHKGSNEEWEHPHDPDARIQRAPRFPEALPWLRRRPGRGPHLPSRPPALRVGAGDLYAPATREPASHGADRLRQHRFRGTSLLD